MPREQESYSQQKLPTHFAEKWVGIHPTPTSLDPKTGAGESGLFTPILATHGCGERLPTRFAEKWVWGPPHTHPPRPKNWCGESGLFTPILATYGCGEKVLLTQVKVTRVECRASSKDIHSKTQTLSTMDLFRHLLTFSRKQKSHRLTNDCFSAQIYPSNTVRA